MAEFNENKVDASGSNDIKSREDCNGDFVPREMFDLIRDEVIFLREELGKTRNLLGEIIKTKSANDDIFANTHRLIIDSLKHSERRPSISSSASQPPTPFSVTQNIPNDIPADSNENVYGEHISGDWCDSYIPSAQPSTQS